MGFTSYMTLLYFTPFRVTVFCFFFFLPVEQTCMCLSLYSKAYELVEILSKPSDSSTDSNIFSDNEIDKVTAVDAIINVTVMKMKKLAKIFL